MLEVYPEKVAKLSPEGFARITSTLDFGLRHQVWARQLVIRISYFHVTGSPLFEGVLYLHNFLEFVYNSRVALV